MSLLFRGEYSSVRDEQSEANILASDFAMIWVLWLYNSLSVGLPGSTVLAFPRG